MSNEKSRREADDDYVDYMDIDAISEEIIDHLKKKHYAKVRSRLAERMSSTSRRHWKLSMRNWDSKIRF